MYTLVPLGRRIRRIRIHRPTWGSVVPLKWPRSVDVLWDSTHLVVWVGDSITNHHGLEVELGNSGNWRKVQSGVVLVNSLYSSASIYHDFEWAKDIR